ncbi:MAG: acetate kinase [Candidatus Saganbacteria bacterium]|nr:acetate kinase [Candidatus Saganbacteria bacterium]
MKILALNCGSSSVKYQLYDWTQKKVICKGMADRVGLPSGSLCHEVPGKPDLVLEKDCPNHCVAIDQILKVLVDPGYGMIADIKEISAVGHRVVHGGEKFQRSVKIDDDVLAAIKEVKDLAPLHNPPNIEGIEAAMKVLPEVPHVAVFDTAFHQTMPPEAYLYAVPFEWYKMYGVRKYGFHGTSHLYVSKRAAVLLKKKPTETNVITLHIGNGVSVAAIKNGVSIDTSMGLTPLAGAIMGTRSGDLDPAIVIFMIEKEGFYAKELDKILNNKSGLLGITGKYSDRREIEKASAAGDERCRMAIDMEAYRLKKIIGSYIASIGQVDAIVFTAGAGEMDANLRARTLAGLESLGIKFDPVKNGNAKTHGVESVISADDSKIKIFVIPTNEEQVFIEDVVAIIEGRYDIHTKFTYSFQSEDYKI